MNKGTLVAVTFCLALFRSMSIGADAASTPAAYLVKADWSVNAAHSLASDPPSLDAVQDFYDRAMGDEAPMVHVCEFRFANMRASGNLSLVVSVEPGNWGCTELDIFDRTPTGFELYFSDIADGPLGHDLAGSVLDMGDNGRQELVLWGGLAGFAMSSQFKREGVGCSAEWPLIFAWTGNTYSDVSDQYKDYYQGYLRSVNARLAAYSSVLAPVAAPTANPVPEISGAAGQAHGELSSDAGEGRLMVPVPVTPAPTPGGAAIPAWAARNEAHRNYPCARIEAAKAEAFLGIHSDSTMSAAIKDSESDDPNKRIVAAVVFSYLGTQEAEKDLKTLSSDADPRVAALAKRAASFSEDPRRGALTMRQKIPMSN